VVLDSCRRGYKKKESVQGCRAGMFACAARLRGMLFVRRSCARLRCVVVGCSLGVVGSALPEVAGPPGGGGRGCGPGLGVLLHISGAWTWQVPLGRLPRAMARDRFIGAASLDRHCPGKSVHFPVRTSSSRGRSHVRTAVARTSAGLRLRDVVGGAVSWRDGAGGVLQSAAELWFCADAAA